MLLRILHQRLFKAPFVNLFSAFMTIVFCLIILEIQVFSQSGQKTDDPKRNEQNIILSEQSKATRQLAEGESHTYRIALKAGEYIHIKVDQRNVDVVLILTAPNNTQLMEMNGLGSPGTEELSWEAKESGDYSLKIQAKTTDAKNAYYEAQLERTEKASAAQLARIAAQRLYMEARQAQLQGESEKAVEKYEEALKKWREANDDKWEAAALYRIGVVYTASNQFEKAREPLEKSLLIRREIKDKHGEGFNLIALGLVYRNLREFEKSRDSFESALIIWRETPDKRAVASLLGNLGNVYGKLNQHEKARNYFEQSVTVLQEIGNKNLKAEALNNLGQTNFLLGQHEKALQYFEESLSLGRELKNRDLEATTLNNIGTVYLELSQNNQAKDYFLEALKIRYEIKDKKEEAGILNGLGIVYNNLDEGKNALEFFEKALAIAREIGDKEGAGNALNSLGYMHIRMRQYEAAQNYFEQALKLWRENGDAFYESLVLSNLGGLYRILNNTEKADIFLQQALKLKRTVGDRSGETHTLFNLANLERDRNNLNLARSQVETAIDITESVRANINNKELRTSYFVSKQELYELYIDILMRLHKDSPSEKLDALALQANERARARSLLELLTESRADIRQGVDSSLLEREQTLQRRLNAAARQRTQLPERANATEKAAKIKEDTDALIAQLQRVEAEIRQKSPRYAALTQPQPLSLKELQTQVLDSNTILLEYALGEDKSYLWAVTTDSITSYELPKRAEIETAAKSYYELLAAGNTRNSTVNDKTKARTNSRSAKEQKPIASADAELSETANRLSQMIIAPVASQLGTKRLLIVADGALQYIPFAALPETISNSATDTAPGKAINAKVKMAANAAKEDTNQPLVINHEIVSLPSASTLAVLRREFSERKPVAGTVAVVADPVFSKDDVRVGEAGSRRQSKTKDAGNEKPSKIPVSSITVTRALEETGVLRDGLNLARLDGTKAEAKSILGLVPVNTGMEALSFQANRSTVTSGELARYRIVHFATHGLLNSEHPELSGIVLSLVDERGEPQDGFLRLHEIYNLKLPAELVVLSACQTALGKEIKGEGLVGLTRGFMYAGAPRVVASLWKVDDGATEELMRRFYGAMLTDKLRPAAALRRAQIEMAKQKARGKPYYWAAFVLQGEWK